MAITLTKQEEGDDPEETLDEYRDSLTGIFLEGECYALAMAISRGTGWPMYGLMQDGIIRHAAVRRPDGLFHDGRGPVKEKNLGIPFQMKPPYVLQKITEADLLATRPVDELIISRARRIAELVWKNLPWQETPRLAKMRIFAEKLEALSREHGIWISSDFPAMLPLLRDGTGDEKGYILTEIFDGARYTINRNL